MRDLAKAGALNVDVGMFDLNSTNLALDSDSI